MKDNQGSSSLLTLPCYFSSSFSPPRPHLTVNPGLTMKHRGNSSPCKHQLPFGVSLTLTARHAWFPVVHWKLWCDFFRSFNFLCQALFHISQLFPQLSIILVNSLIHNIHSDFASLNESWLLLGLFRVGRYLSFLE